jgi:GAF domain-containing protein
MTGIAQRGHVRALIDVIHEFTSSLLNPYDLDELLGRLVDHATAVLDGVGAGIMLQSRDGHLDFAVASCPEVTEIERHQDHVRSGTCHEAFITNTTITVDDLEASDRWPTYRVKALDLGLRSVMGAPLNAHGQTIGVLNVYRDTAGPWTDEDVESCEILAAMGAGYILHANQLRASQELAEQLQEALDSRAIIERAKGLLMATEQVDAETAFKGLRQASMDTNRKLRDIARDIVERHIRHGH